jgi:hypothetical protein
MTAPELPVQIAKDYARIQSVESVVLAGSQTAGAEDEHSDIDLYVYSTEPVSMQERERIASSYAERAEVGNTFWEPGDEWTDADLKIGVDVMFRSEQWIENQLNRILVLHQASVGYSTCFWYNVLTSQILFDRNGWFANLQATARIPYPEKLREAIIAKNYPILRNTQSSYRTQIVRAIERNDRVSVNHRIAAFLASYFDVLFALNRVPHPGEKRLVPFVEKHCAIKPVDFSQKISGFLMNPMEFLDQLINDLDDLIEIQRRVR